MCCDGRPCKAWQQTALGGLGSIFARIGRTAGPQLADCYGPDWRSLALVRKSGGVGCPIWRSGVATLFREFPRRAGRAHQMKRQAGCAQGAASM